MDIVVDAMIRIQLGKLFKIFQPQILNIAIGVDASTIESIFLEMIEVSEVSYKYFASHNGVRKMTTLQSSNRRTPCSKKVMQKTNLY
jgi:hypothetical protein